MITIRITYFIEVKVGIDRTVFRLDRTATLPAIPRVGEGVSWGESDGESVVHSVDWNLSTDSDEPVTVYLEDDWTDGVADAIVDLDRLLMLGWSFRDAEREVRVREWLSERAAKE